MRCISCIGKSREEKTGFSLRGQQIMTDLVHEAVWHLFHPDEIVLAIQDPVQAYIAAECESRGMQIRKLWIPDGTGSDDLWDTFTLLGAVPQDGEEILFDITGGCHILPFLISLVASYIRETRQVKIAGVVYALAPDENGIRHFVDLTPVMGVNDWISGVRSLTEHTNATRIQHLLSGLQGELHRMKPQEHPPTRMAGWGHLLGTFTRAVRLSRPVDALYAGWGITRDLPLVREELNRFAPALNPVLDDMEMIRKMGAPPPPEGITTEYLIRQLSLVRYQIHQGLDVQAASLSREWLISATMILFGCEEQWRDAEVRHEVSRTLTGFALTMQKKLSEDTRFTHLLLTMENRERLVPIWERVSDLRNDLAHCGMNERDESIRSLLRRTSRLPDDLTGFARISGLITGKDKEDSGNSPS